MFKNQPGTSASYLAEVPPGIKNEAVLLDWPSAILRFPDYFGRNWDALEECIRDLNWIPPGDVILMHRDLPLKGDLASLSIYLSILNDAVEKWNASGERKLLVVFPPEARGLVQSILADGKGFNGSSGGC